MYKAFLHRKLMGIYVTQTKLHYEGSITLPDKWIKEVGFEPFERVDVLNLSNGERITTYIIPSSSQNYNPFKDVVCLNGPAARKFMVGDEIVVLSYVEVDHKETRPKTITYKLLSDQEKKDVCTKEQFEIYVY